MSISRFIFALEILSFIKVSSFRLVKEIEVGAMPVFDFLVFGTCLSLLFTSASDARGQGAKTEPFAGRRTQTGILCLKCLMRYSEAENVFSEYFCNPL